jgi:phage tail-like protein
VSAGFSRVSGLSQETEVVEYREGIDGASVRKLPGLTTFEDLVLEKGKSTNEDFQIWQNQVFEVRERGGLPDPAYRRNVIIQLLNRNNVPVKEWVAFRAWATKLEHGDFDAASSDVLLETLTIAHEGLKAVKPGSGKAIAAAGAGGAPVGP